MLHPPPPYPGQGQNWMIGGNPSDNFRGIESTNLENVWPRTQSDKPYNKFEFGYIGIQSSPHEFAATQKQIVQVFLNCTTVQLF